MKKQKKKKKEREIRMQKLVVAENESQQRDSTVT
jgi:hypothetical protein